MQAEGAGKGGEWGGGRGGGGGGGGGRGGRGGGERRRQIGCGGDDLLLAVPRHLLSLPGHRLVYCLHWALEEEEDGGLD